MTSRNLNTTWRDIIFKQYRQDHTDDVPFPIRYLLHNPTWKQDLWYEIPRKIDPDSFRRSIIAFHRTTRGTSSPIYSDENLSVRPRKPSTTSQGQDPALEPETGLDLEKEEEEEDEQDALPSRKEPPTSQHGAVDSSG